MASLSIKNNQQLSDFVQEALGLKSKIDGIQGASAAEISRIKKETRVQVGEIEEELKPIAKAIYAYARRKKMRSIELPGALLQFRTTPPKVNISNTEKVIANLINLGLKRFIRTKTEKVIDKRRILQEARAVQGVEGLSITQKEVLSIKPLQRADTETTFDVGSNTIRITD